MWTKCEVDLRWKPNDSEVHTQRKVLAENLRALFVFYLWRMIGVYLCFIMMGASFVYSHVLSWVTRVVVDTLLCSECLVAA